MSTSRSVRGWRHAPTLIGVALGLLCSLVALAPANAEEKVKVGTASFVLPDRWESEPVTHFDVANMPASVSVAASEDGRVSVYLIVIDPFGIDIEDWQLVDLLGPTLVDLLALNGANPDEVRVRRSHCTLGGEQRTARLIVYPAGSDEDPHLYAGLGCGIEEPNRWAAAFVVVESQYSRPLLLRQEMLEAASILDSFRFD